MTQAELEQRLADAWAAASVLVLELERAGVLDQTTYPVLWEAVNKLFFALGSGTTPGNDGPAGSRVREGASASMMTEHIEQLAVGEATPGIDHPGPDQKKRTDSTHWHDLNAVFAAVEAAAKRGKRPVEPE